MRIEIRMDNAAFDDPGYELARILRKIGGELFSRGWGNIDAYGAHILDANGNKVGTAVVSGRDARQPK